MVRYLEPLQLVRESTMKPGTVFLGLSFSVEYVSLAIYDHGFHTSPFYCKCPRDERLLDYLLAYIQSLKKDFRYRLEGIIVANSSSVAAPDMIHNLMDNLCKKGKFENLSYTCWEHDNTYCGTRTNYSAQYMLPAFLHNCNFLQLSDEERCFKRKAKLLKSIAEHKLDLCRELLPLFGASKNRNYHMPSAAAFLGLIFSDVYVRLALYDGCYCHAEFIKDFPIDDSLFDKLIDAAQMIDGPHRYYLEGIIFAYSSSSSKDPSELNIDYLIDGLCKKGKLKGLKYTFVEDNIALEDFPCYMNTLFSANNRVILENWSRICCSGADYMHPELPMVQYLEPLHLFRQCMKRVDHMPSSVFLGLSFSDDYVSVAMSDDCYLTARFLDMYPRNDSLSDKLVAVVQMLNKDLEYDLEGIIVAYSSSTAPLEKICNLMEGLRKMGKFVSLKYTFWQDNIAAEGLQFERNKFGSLFWGTTSEIHQAYGKLFSAEYLLKAFLHSFNTLHLEKDWVEWENFKREKRCMICRSGAEHKMVQYLEPLQLFRESMKRTFYMPSAVFLGLSISDKNVSLARSDHHYSHACHYGMYPIDDENLFEKLLGSVLKLKIDGEFELLGIVVADRSSKENPPSLKIDDLMDSLCKNGRFESLKYTRWEDDISSSVHSVLFECYGTGWKTFPVDCSRECSERQEYIERTSAQNMLGAFLNVFKTLHRNKDLRKMRGWIPSGEEAVQDVPQQSRAQVVRWRIQTRRCRIQTKRWRIQTKPQ